ncbi:Blue-sensitive opsin [Collichthys lucidus]|uniref:Blue-sensitive opsin n=1 Tax=Collichthys lucidus TaxID=240159 RepID=A0A4V6AN30_COLLU|nr:Blue-sensitive opsin [Collichthys lucidus]
MLPEDFYIPIPLDTNNITFLSPFLVPQDHLANSGTFYAMAVYMFFIFTVGTGINVCMHHRVQDAPAAKAQAESASTQKAEKEVTGMVVLMVMGFPVCCLPYASFAVWVVNNRGQPFDLRLATIPSCFSKASAVYNPIIYIFFNKQFRSCIMKMLGMGGVEDEESSTHSSVTEVSKVGPA